MQAPRNERQKAGDTLALQPTADIVKQLLQDLAATAKSALCLPNESQPTGSAPCASKPASPDITDKQIAADSDFETRAEPTERATPGTPTQKGPADLAPSGCTTPRSECSNTCEVDQAACREDRMCEDISIPGISAADLPLSSPQQLQALSSDDSEAMDGHQDDQSPPCPEEPVIISSLTPVSPTSNTDKVLHTG